MIADVAASLREEARAADERRLLVLAGEREACLDAAGEAIDAAGLARERSTVVGERGLPGVERIPQTHAGRLLGTTREAVVFCAHDGLWPNALGRTVGAVDGGGLLVLCCPPLRDWPDRRDGFDERLAAPPFEVRDVTGRFRRRFVDTLRAHPGVAVVDVDGGTVERDGLTHPAPRIERPAVALPENPAFPRAAYEACLTGDQVEALASLEALREPGHAVVVEADRGRGKSSVAGLAAGSLAAAGDDVLVTAPGFENAREGFVRARALLESLDALESSGDETGAGEGRAGESDAHGGEAVADGRDRREADAVPRRLETSEGGRVRFAAPTAVDPTEPDVLIVDEAAAVAVPLLGAFLAADRVAFTTTVHGYEGAGRGFSVRFRDRLDAAALDVADVKLVEPIRYAAGDPVEVWAFRALLLDASPAAADVVESARPASTTYRTLDPDELVADEPLLREAFGLLVLAHYRTEPDDLARLLDAPNVTARALCEGGHVASVALLAREGGLPADLRAHLYEGGRVRGNMLPDVLTSQLRDEAAGAPTGWRVMRIATHPAVRSRGLGSRLLAAIDDELSPSADWLGTGFGATPDLLSFWEGNGYGTVHLATTRNESSGEHSALMLRPTSDAGRDLHDRHATWFAGRVRSQLSDALSDLEPDVVRAALRATDASVTPALSPADWRLVAGTAYGPGLIDVDPGPFRRLAVAHLVDPVAPDALSPDQERLLVLKVLQGRGWREVTDRLAFHGVGECMRALGEAFQPIVDARGDEAALAEKARYEPE